MNFLRKHLKIFFIVILAAIILPFLFFGIGSYTEEDAKEDTALTIGKKRISTAKFAIALKDARSHLLIDFAESRNITPDQLPMYQDWLNQMLQNFDFNSMAVQELLLQEESKKLAFCTSPKEVADWLSGFPLFQRNGQFSIETYQSLVETLFNTWPYQFEESLRRILSVKKLQNFILNSVIVSEKEVYEEYKKQNEKVVVYSIQFDTNNYLDKTGQISNEELEKYYNGHKEDFRQPEKIRIAYLLFDPANIKEGVEINQKEIEEYYQSNTKEFSDKDGNTEPLDKVRDKITETISKQKKDEIIRQQALEASEALTTDKRINDMRNLAKEKNYILKETEFIDRNGMVPELGWDPQLMQKIWNMEAETISDFIHVDNRWIIVSPSERKAGYIPELKDIQAQITEIIKKQKAGELASNKTQEVFDKIPKDKPFTMAVKSLKLKPVKSAPLTRQDPLGKAAFEKTTGIINIPSGTVVYSVREFIKINPANWEKEKDAFTKNYLNQKKKQVYQAFIQSLLTSK